MNGFSAIIPGISASVPVLADILVAVLLSWIDLTLYKTSQNAARAYEVLGPPRSQKVKVRWFDGEYRGTGGVGPKGQARRALGRRRGAAQGRA